MGDAIKDALKFIWYGHSPQVGDEWNAKGVAMFPLSRAEYESLKKVILVGVGELTKTQ